MQMEEKQQESSSDSSDIIYTLKSRSSMPPLRVTMELDSNPISLEVDTGAAFLLISESTFRELWSSRSLSKVYVRLCTYSGEPIQVLRSLTVVVMTPRIHS